MTTKEQVEEALHQAKHYSEMTEDALANGKFDDAAGWLEALCEEVLAALGKSDE